MKLKIIILLIDDTLSKKNNTYRYSKEVIRQITSPAPDYFEQDETALGLPLIKENWIHRFYRRALVVARDPEYKLQEQFEAGENWKQDLQDQDLYDPETNSVFLQFVTSTDLFQKMIDQVRHFHAPEGLNIDLKEMTISRGQYAEIKKRLQVGFGPMEAIKNPLQKNGIKLSL